MPNAEYAVVKTDGNRVSRTFSFLVAQAPANTTLLNAMARAIPPQDRIVLIEETSEILIDTPNLVRFEAR